MFLSICVNNIFSYTYFYLLEKMENIKGATIMVQDNDNMLEKKGYRECNFRPNRE